MTSMLEEALNMLSLSEHMEFCRRHHIRAPESDDMIQLQIQYEPPPPIQFDTKTVLRGTPVVNDEIVSPKPAPSMTFSQVTNNTSRKQSDASVPSKKSQIQSKPVDNGFVKHLDKSLSSEKLDMKKIQNHPIPAAAQTKNANKSNPNNNATASPRQKHKNHSKKKKQKNSVSDTQVVLECPAEGTSAWINMKGKRGKSASIKALQKVNKGDTFADKNAFSILAPADSSDGLSSDNDNDVPINTECAEPAKPKKSKKKKGKAKEAAQSKTGESVALIETADKYVLKERRKHKTLENNAHTSEFGVRDERGVLWPGLRIHKHLNRRVRRELMNFYHWLSQLDDDQVKIMQELEASLNDQIPSDSDEQSESIDS